MRKLYIPIFAVILSLGSLLAQENLTYQVPSPEILQLADYERAPGVQMDSKKTVMLFLYRNTYKSLDDLNQEELRLGGLRINPVTNISSTTTFINNLKIRKMNEKVEVQVIGLPTSPRISNISWSPDEKKIAFLHTTSSGNELWLIDIQSAKANKLTEANLNANTGNPINWCSDSQGLLIKVLPKNRSALIDPKKNLPTGPTVSVSDGSKSQNRTYQDLLKNKTDEANFESIVRSELLMIKLDGSSKSFLPADLYIGESYSPDGNYLMVVTLAKPFSYIVPYYRFPMTTTVYDKTGKLVKVVNQTPILEVMPKGFMAVTKEKRNMDWRNDHPATLYYVQALDQGDPAIEVPFRDEVFLWKAPFDNSATSILKTPQRFSYIDWGNETYALAYDDWYDTRNTKTYLFAPSKPDQKPKVLFDRNSQDVYSDPGSVELVKNHYGMYVLNIQGDNIYFLGDGHTPKGQFPFIDEMNLKTGSKKRIYQSKLTDKKESLISITDIKKGDVLIQMQSKTEYPNYYIRNIKAKNQLTQMTSFKNPFESIKDVHKQVIHYKREDGVDLSGTLYLPAGYDFKKKEKLPLLIWAYPTEFKDKNSAGQSTANPNEFTFPYYGSFVYWVTKGYAVLDDASFPIIGEGETEPNDNFISQLVDNAEAAINALDTLGYIDRTRVACGGHSYGAFMVANLLTHSDLFACGIARSGAYNRTLTPFGFQSEQRNYWDAPDVYNTMSPFMTADKMKHPLMLVHGEADNNPGTFTLQTERYFQALKGLGAPVRMVLLPKESHSYVAKENIFHLLWEQDQFLEKYLKKPAN